MSADFWAGYISGAVGILIGNPLDLLKVRLQAGNLNLPVAPTTNTSARTTTPRSHISYTSQFSTASTLIRGATAPILGYGALNALLFITYNRSSSLLTHGTLSPPLSPTPTNQPNLWTTFVAGALGGLATWVISTPTELIKCRAQISTSSSASSSLSITRDVLRREGIRGLYFGGVVTALRDSIGYGFYFWSYEASSRLMVSRMRDSGAGEGKSMEAAKVLLCGGFAGVITWASVFPLDVIKTRVQTQAFSSPIESAPLIGSSRSGTVGRRSGAMEVARNAYKNEGAGVFFRGLGICSVRAFIVNAAQWAVYEWIMRELDPSRKISGMKDTTL
jgi:solute carrier family 25 (mitochondrial carnitine/acylcarnitine transporter), member 20/29